MSDHALMMTLPRSGPFNDRSDLRAAGFTPIPSTRDPTQFSCWVQHVWDVGDAALKKDAASLASDFPGLVFVLVWDDGRITRLTA